MKALFQFLKVFWHYAEKAKNFATTFLFLVCCFFGILIMFAVLGALSKLSGGDVSPQKGALLIKISGYLPEKVPLKETLADFTDSLSNSLEDSPVSLHDVVQAIQRAKTDPKITGIVLETDEMSGVGLTKIRILTKELREFKASQKKIFAINQNYTQQQYLLASVADQIFLNNMGSVVLTGFSNYQLFIKDALDKLKINFHIFRVGAFKSAVEPFLRNDMSVEAKEASEAWLGELWQTYKDEIKTNRSLPKIVDLNLFIDKADRQLEEVGGDLALLALHNGLVDVVCSSEEQDSNLIAYFKRDATTDSYSKTSVARYLKQNKTPAFFYHSQDQIGVIYAQGSIVDGEQSEANIGGTTYAKIIRAARLNTQIKALVLRVDSGGGSVFASELIRQELVAFKNTGRPVIASFSSVAASGGYWISTPADEIWAAPTTLTGSIGVFGILPTFEQMINHLGVHVDGVATTELSKEALPLTPLNPVVEASIQRNIEFIYDKFITLVAESRKMSKEDVHKIAQGRVWSGLQAHKLGLVDSLGDLQDAIAAAAKRAKLTKYEVVTLEKDLNDKQQFMNNLLKNVSTEDFAILGASPSLLERKFLEHLKKNYGFLSILSDPNHVYSYSFLENIP